MPIRFALSRLFAVCLAVACAREREGSETRTDRPASSDRHLDWVITPRGLGPLHAGMSRAEAEAVVGGSLMVTGDTAWRGCGYVSSERLPPGTHVMVEDGTIARVDVDGGSTATAEGARIGDSEERIRQLYGARVLITPHKYTSGHT